MSQIANAQPQGGLILRVASSIPGGSPELGKSTGPRTTDRERPVKPQGQFPAAHGPQTFFRRASDNIYLSSERSATSRLSRAFSSSTCRSRRSSLTPKSPTEGRIQPVELHAYTICSSIYASVADAGGASVAGVRQCGHSPSIRVLLILLLCSETASLSGRRLTATISPPPEIIDGLDLFCHSFFLRRRQRSLSMRGGIWRRSCSGRLRWWVWGM